MFTLCKVVRLSTKIFSTAAESSADDVFSFAELFSRRDDWQRDDLLVRTICFCVPTLRQSSCFHRFSSFVLRPIRVSVVRVVFKILPTLRPEKRQRVAARRAELQTPKVHLTRVHQANGVPARDATIFPTPDNTSPARPPPGSLTSCPCLFSGRLRIPCFLSFAGESMGTSREACTMQTKISLASTSWSQNGVCEQACWFRSVAVRWSFVSVSFTKKTASRRSPDSCVRSCLAQTLFPSCFQHDPVVILNPQYCVSGRHI